VTILNVFVERERALMAVDTIGQRADGSRAMVAKMLLLPHANAAVACRGHMSFIAGVWATLLQTPGDFDALAEILPVTCESVHELFKLYLAESKEVLDARFGNGDEQYIVIVGWSSRHNEMRAFELRRNGGDGRFVSRAIKSVYIAPWTSDLAASHPRPATGDLMEALFLAQQSLYEREAPHATPGGALIVAEIRLGSTKTWMQCNIDRLNGESAGLAPRPDRVLHP
jgi:hypothetical protein